MKFVEKTNASCSLLVTNINFFSKNIDTMSRKRLGEYYNDHQGENAFIRQQMF